MKDKMYFFVFVSGFFLMLIAAAPQPEQQRPLHVIHHSELSLPENYFKP